MPLRSDIENFALIRSSALAAAVRTP